MSLADSVPPAVTVGMWGGIITVTLLLIGTIVRVSFSWSRLVGQMDHVVKQFDRHLEDERRDRDEHTSRVEARLVVLDTRIRRAEKSINDIQQRMRDGRST